MSFVQMGYSLTGPGVHGHNHSRAFVAVTREKILLYCSHDFKKIRKGKEAMLLIFLQRK